MATAAISQFTTQQKRLLDLELHADNDLTQDRDSGGFSLPNVHIIDTSVGLYGRTVISFGSNQTSNDESQASNTPLLPAHRLTVGDEIEILPKNNGKNKARASGVVCAMDDHSISIALSEKKRQPTSLKKSVKKNEKDIPVNSLQEDEELLGNGPFTLIPRSGVEVHKKMVMALEDLEKYGVDHPIAGEIISAAFDVSNHLQPGNNLYGDDEMTKARMEELEREYQLESTRLDYSQKEAVVFALNSRCPISLIHGPPGTGKTTTVAELIRCAVNIKKWKVLVTAPSNVAVDNVLERIMSLEDESTANKTTRKNKKSNTKINAVRLGHPARIQQSIQKYSLESQVQSSDGTELVRDCRKELNHHLRTLSDPKSRAADKRHAYGEMKSLRKEIRSREEKVVGEIVRRANVVLATNVGAAGSLFRHLVDGKGEFAGFDLVIVDEAAQALEASCWISLLRGKKAVLAGDHCQLPPTIKCANREVQTELGKTLFERLMNAYDSNSNTVTNKPSKMLEVQYRMHEDIANWASGAMYHGKLISHESVRHRKLSSLPQVKAICTQPPTKEEDVSALLQNVTLTLIDTTGCDFNEMTTDAGSRYNEGEAELVVSHVKSLLALGLRAQDIAVITPYNGQVELLRKRLLSDVPKLEIRSVDGFQGGEREAVVLSLVRSSERGGKDGIGFLRDERRLNVAITRAKRHCALICDCETVSQNKFIKNLVEWMEQKGDYRSAAELIPSNEISPSIPLATSSGNKKIIQSKSTVANQDKKNQTKKELTAIKSDLGNTVSDEEGKGEKQDPLKEGARRRALMNSIATFSETEEKGEQFLLKNLSDFDLVVARELASQLGLGCDENGQDRNELTLTIVKKHSSKFKSPETESVAQETNTCFSQLKIDDESSDEDAEMSSSLAQNDLLKDLAFERQKRQALQQQTQPQTATNTAQSKKTKKKKKGQKLGGEKKQTKELDKDDDLKDLDDMAFLDAQIEKVQTSHGRNIEAKGKGYKSIINGVLLTKHDRLEPKRSNTVAANSLQAKIKAKSEDRQVKKKKKGAK